MSDVPHRPSESRGRSGVPVTRRQLLHLPAALGLLGAAGLASGSRADAVPVRTATPTPTLTPVPAPSGIVKPTPPELFTLFGTNAETKWEALRGTGYHTPVDRFFVRNHTSTPQIDAKAWRLRLFGDGLHGEPGAQNPFELSLRQLRALPAHEVSAFIECAGNGRSFYTTQQQQSVSGTAWRLGAVGVARWRGVRLSTVLRRAGLKPSALSVLPTGLDDNFVTGGVDLGPVRRPLPIAKALDDVLLAYEMNGEPLPPDHGFPLRVVVPSWIGIASIKWLGSIEVSTQVLTSPWDTQYYRFFGPGFPAEGTAPLTRQVVKSAFELPWAATVEAGRRQVLTGRSWSGNGRIRRVEVSLDGGSTWRKARTRRDGVPLGSSRRDAVPFERNVHTGWTRWEVPWRPKVGSHELLARAVDVTGVTQPGVAPYNTLGYLFGGVVRHPVTAI